MMPPPFFSQLVVVGRLGLCGMLHDAWPRRCVASPHKPAKPITPHAVPGPTALLPLCCPPERLSHDVPLAPGFAQYNVHICGDDPRRQPAIGHASGHRWRTGSPRLGCARAMGRLELWQPLPYAGMRQTEILLRMVQGELRP